MTPPPRQLPEFVTFVLDQLHELEQVRAKRMFGGYGLYQRDTFFGIIHEDRLYLKTDDESRPEFTKRGSAPFQPTPRQTLHTYLETPAEIIENPRSLTEWAERAVRAKLGEI